MKSFITIFFQQGLARNHYHGEIRAKKLHRFHYSNPKYVFSRHISSIILYFNELCKHTPNFKTAANLMNGVIKSYLNENAKSIDEINLKPDRIAELIKLIDENKISNSVATSKIFPVLLNSNLSAEQIAIDNNWIQESNADTLTDLIDEIIKKYPQKVKDYQSGKKGLIGLFVGEVMKLSKGKADPRITNELIRKKLD